MAEERLGMRQGGGTGGPADAALVERARGGDRAAYDALVRRHFARVHGLCFRLVGSHEDAEDLAQECFVRAHRALDWFRGESSFRTWLYRVALSLVRDHLRAKGRRARPRSIEAEELASALVVPAGRGPSDEAARRELVAALQGALSRLPQRAREAFVLRAFEELPYEEVGEVLGITATTARVHVMKARRLLARAVEPWTRGGPWMGGSGTGGGA